ncbi:MAG: GYF domain-containing protein [Pseudobdellovibrio sp.]
MSTYYIASHGQQQGPYTLQEIELQLSNQRINWHDYIYDEKVQDWVLLMEYPHFTELFNQSFLTPMKPGLKVVAEGDPLKQRIWFVLKQNNNYGPFSKAELIQMLQGKTLHEFDFIWHEGMKSWRRLADVEEFSVNEVRALFEKFKNKKDQDPKDTLFFRRKFPRVRLNSQAIVHDKKKVYKSVGVEVSEGGAGLLIENASFEKDQQIYLHFKPANEVPAFNAICRIVSKKGNVYGVQFLKISAVAKSSIAQYANKAIQAA